MLENGHIDKVVGFLLPPYVVRRKVMFSVVCVCDSVYTPNLKTNEFFYLTPNLKMNLFYLNNLKQFEVSCLENCCEEAVGVCIQEKTLF